MRFSYSVAALDLLTNAIDKCGPRVTEKLRLAPHLLANFEIVSELNVTGEVEEAASMQKEVAERRRRILGEQHPDTIRAMNKLANTLGELGQLE